MPPLRIRADTLDIELIEEAIRARIRARSGAQVPVDRAELLAEREQRLAALDDWNFPRPLWHAMWPPNLEPWNLEEGFPIASHRPGVGPLLVAGKRLQRWLLRLLLRPLLVRQAEVNRAVSLMALTLADEAAETRLHLRAVEARIARMASELRAVRGEEQPLVVIEDGTP